MSTIETAKTAWVVIVGLSILAVASFVNANMFYGHWIADSYPDRGLAQLAAHSRHSLKRIREIASVLGDNRSDKTSSTARTLWRSGRDEE